ncbi:DUF3253 domain-containing protein [Denitrobaculum tricleocarpae]|nr:DUF3253 domain-containing protein [Denitrobaculum tricleocarpae]
MTEETSETPDAQKDDPIARMILQMLEEGGAARNLDPNAVARSFAAGRAKRNDPPDLWRKYLPAVRQQALHLARQGRLTILRKGKVADPHAPIKGLIRLALPGAAEDGAS